MASQVMSKCLRAASGVTCATRSASQSHSSLAMNLYTDSVFGQHPILRIEAVEVYTVGVGGHLLAGLIRSRVSPTKPGVGPGGGAGFHENPHVGVLHVLLSRVAPAFVLHPTRMCEVNEDVPEAALLQFAVEFRGHQLDEFRRERSATAPQIASPRWKSQPQVR